ncbi:MAG: PAS domain S-box protein [Gammaproteobacteria bacterium]
MQPVFDKVLAPLLDALPDAIVLVDEGGVILFANKGIKELLGFDATDLVDQSLSVLIPSRIRESHTRMVAEYWKDPVQRAMGARPFLYALSKAGDEIPVTISLGPVTLSGRRCCVAVLRDASAIRNQITDVLGGIQV